MYKHMNKYACADDKKATPAEIKLYKMNENRSVMKQKFKDETYQPQDHFLSQKTWV